MKSKQKINPTRKCITGIVVMMILVTVLWLFMLSISMLSTQQFEDYLYNLTGERFGNSEEPYIGISNSCSEVATNMEEVSDSYYSQLQVKADLSARANFDRVKELGDESISKVGGGVIVKVADGQVTIPEGARYGILNYGDHIKGGKGLVEYYTPTAQKVRRDILLFSRISGPYYYVEIVNGDQLLEYIDKYVNYDDVLQGIESAYRVEIFMVCPNRAKSRYFQNLNGNLIYYPEKAYTDDPNGTMNAEEFGIPSDTESLLKLNGKLSAGGGEVAATYVVREMDELDAVLVIRSYDIDYSVRIAEQAAVGFIVILVLMITFIVWITSVYREMTTGIMTEKKKTSYSPVRVRLIALSYGILGTIIVLGISMFFRSLSNTYAEINDMQNTLRVMDVQIVNSNGYAEQRAEARRSLYLEYARRSAALIEINPELNNKEDLAAINSIIGSEYIMIFDREGKETGTSADYINIELGDDKAANPSSTADFRRILKGVMSIIHKPFKDELTGKTLEMYGVRIKDPQGGGYGVLLLAVKPDSGNEQLEDERSTNSILRALTPSGRISFLVDASDGAFINVSNEELWDAFGSLQDMGIGNNMLRDGVADFVRIGAIKYLMVSEKALGGGILYVCTPNEVLLRNGFQYGFICAIGFAIAFAILCLYLTAGYSNETIRKIEESGGEAAQEETGRTGKVRIHTRIGSIIQHLLGNTTPERKAMLVFEVFLGVIFAWTFLDMRTNRGSEGQLVLDYVLTGKWNKGFNIFSVTSIILLLLTLILGMMFVRFVFRTLGKMLNSRGQTICRLISNMINYLAILVFIYYALSYLGVDTNAILASVGVIGIGVSMGARDLIADIFAGVSMIFEGEYQVGDIVNIDGYRGMVQEVGVRSTRLVGRGGNIKVIGNKDIKSVTNLTKMNSWVAVTIKVDVNYPLRDAEEIINEALPRIGEKCHEIISGPYYKGVLSVEMGFAVLSIIAECNEDNYHKVERVLVREVLLALREKNVPVR